MSKLRIVCISDTHGKHLDFPTLPKGDILIHAGDLTNVGEPYMLKSFLNWFESFDHPHKIFIAGNHDFCFEKSNRDADVCNEMLKLYPSIKYLHHEAYKIEEYDLNLFGSPYTPYFYNWAFNVHRGRLHHYWSQVLRNTEVLITHGPCYGILDKPLSGESCGDEELLEKVLELPNLKLHVFGHIHTNGKVQKKKKKNIQFVNASLLNEQYVGVNKPVVVDLERRENSWCVV